MTATATQPLAIDAALPQRDLPCGPLPPVTHDPALETVFWTFSNDRKILTLPEIRAPASFEPPAPHSCQETRIVGLCPEKSATLQLVSTGSTNT